MSKWLRKTMAGALVLSMFMGTNITQVSAAENGSYTIDETTFPDYEIYSTVRRYDSNGDGILSKGEAAKADYLRVSEQTTDLTGVLKIFPNVKRVSIESGKNKEVTVNNSKISEIDVYGDYITALKGASPKTIRVAVYKQKGTLDFSKVSGYGKATAFYVVKANAKKIVMPNTAKLEKVGLSSCGLSKIDTSVYKNAKELTLDGNNLKSIDLKKNTKLTSLSCYSNKLTSLNISANTKLKDIGVGWNKLEKIDITKNKNMQRVIANSNKLKSLKSGKNTNIVELELSYNKLSSLDLTKYPNLKKIYCDDNSLKTLSLTGNKKVEALGISGLSLNKLTYAKPLALKSLSTDVKNCKYVKDIKLKKNFYVNLYIKNNQTYNLQTLLPVLKGYTFSSWNENVSEKGIVQAKNLEKNAFVGCTAKKGNTTVNVYIRTEE